MAEHSGSQEMLDYLHALTEYIKTPACCAVQVESGKPTIDSLFYYYQSIAEIKKIEWDIQWMLPRQFPLSDVELCTLLSNLLKNAVEACERLGVESGRSITVRTSATKFFWCLTIENTYDGIAYVQEDFSMRTRKSDAQYHGIGLSSVAHIVQTHHGTLDLFPKEKLYFVGITIPID